MYSFFDWLPAPSGLEGYCTSTLETFFFFSSSAPTYVTEGLFIKGNQHPHPNCCDSAPLSLFYLDISTSCNYICKTGDTQKDAFVRQIEWCYWSDWSAMIITAGDHLAPQTGSGGKYVMRPACSVLTFCERRFNSVTHEEKLRGPRLDYWHKYMLSGLFSSGLCFCCSVHVAHDWCSVSRFNNDCVSFLTLSWFHISVLVLV